MSLTGKNRLETLPAELRLAIYAYLDYGSAISLSTTSRFFHCDRPCDALTALQKSSFLYIAEISPRNREVLACYKCMRLLPFSAFSSTVWCHHYLVGYQQFERYCVQCKGLSVKEIAEEARRTPHPFICGPGRAHGREKLEVMGVSDGCNRFVGAPRCCYAPRARLDD